MLKRVGVALVAAAAMTSVTAAPAWAGGGGEVAVSCQNSPTAGCVVGAGTPGQGDAVKQVTPQPGATGHGTQCRNWTGEIAACVSPWSGWMGSDGCYYKVNTTWKPPPWDTADQPPPGQAGAYYDKNCVGTRPFPGTGTGIVWLPTGTAPGSLPSPIVLARQARGRLALPPPALAMSPPGPQLVNLPTWMWLPRRDWGTRSATASVPGESVTASATARSVTLAMGDGATVTCAGPGTPYEAGQNPAGASPDCGHTYRSSSVTQPRSAFAVTVVVHWTVSWAGGGQQGTFPNLTTTARLPVSVVESQALNTQPPRGAR